MNFKPGEQRALTVTFSPTEVKTGHARFQLQTPGFCRAVSIELLGVGVGECLTWSPPVVDFGTVAPGESATATLTFSNGCGAGASLANFATTGAAFSVATSAAVPLAPAVRADSGAIIPATASLNLSFQPSFGGPANGLLNFTTSLPRYPSGAAPLRGYQ